MRKADRESIRDLLVVLSRRGHTEAVIMSLTALNIAAGGANLLNEVTMRRDSFLRRENKDSDDAEDDVSS